MIVLRRRYFEEVHRLRFYRCTVGKCKEAGFVGYGGGDTIFTVPNS